MDIENFLLSLTKKERVRERKLIVFIPKILTFNILLTLYTLSFNYF